MSESEDDIIPDDKELIKPYIDTTGVAERLVEGRKVTRDMVNAVLRPVDKEGKRLPVNAVDVVVGMYTLYHDVTEDYLNDETRDPVLDRYIQVARNHLREAQSPTVVAQAEDKFRAVLAARESSGANTPATSPNPNVG